MFYNHELPDSRHSVYKFTFSSCIIRSNNLRCKDNSIKICIMSLTGRKKHFSLSWVLMLEDGVLMLLVFCIIWRVFLGSLSVSVTTPACCSRRRRRRCCLHSHGSHDWPLKEQHSAYQGTINEPLRLQRRVLTGPGRLQSHTEALQLIAE